MAKCRATDPLCDSGPEPSLRHSDERFSEAFRANPVPIVITSWDEGRFIEANDAFLAMTGYRREELIGRTSREFAFWPQPDDRRKTLDMLTQTGTAVRRAAHPIRAKNGDVCLADLTMERITLDGRPCLLSILYDVTERIHIEQELQSARAELERRVEERTRELREQRDFAERLIDTAPVIVLVLDRAGRYIRFNRYMQEISGFSLDEVRGKCGIDVGVVPEHRRAAAETLERIARGETVRGQVIESIAKDGRHVQVEWHFAPLHDIGDGSPGILAIGQDITERLLAEAALRHSELLRQAAEKLAVTGRLAAEVAHEINNPLAGLQSSFLLIKDAVPADHPYFSFVGRIEKEIGRIAEIVRQMYGLHRPQVERLSEVAVTDVLRDVAAMLAPRASLCGVCLEVAEGCTVPVVRTSEGALRQILYNLAANAIDASPRGGRVELAASLSEGILQIAVSDEGPGIADELRERIFEPFFSTKSGTPTGGMGLGLAICREQVEAMRGTLSFKSQPGKGTVFYLVLPSGAS